MKMTNLPTLDSEVNRLGLKRVPVSELLRLQCTEKVTAVCGVIERLLYESGSDVTVLLRDATGACQCCIHSSAIAQYPCLSEVGTAVVLCSATCVPSRPTPFGTSFPTLLVCLENIVSLFVRDANESNVAEATSEGNVHVGTNSNILELADEFD